MLYHYIPPHPKRQAGLTGFSLIKLLGYLHGLLQREAQFPGGLLLQGAGGERESGSFPFLFPFYLEEAVPGSLQLLDDGQGLFSVSEVWLPLAAFLSPATLRLRPSTLRQGSGQALLRTGSGQALLFALDDDVRWPEVVVHVYGHLVGREITDVSHGGFDGVVFAEVVAEGSRFGRTLHDD